MIVSKKCVRKAPGKIVLGLLLYEIKIEVLEISEHIAVKQYENCVHFGVVYSLLSIVMFGTVGGNIRD